MKLLARAAVFTISVLGIIGSADAATKKTTQTASSLACYVCKPPYVGDDVSRTAANNIRADRYSLFADQSSIQTCDTFSSTGAAFQKACTTTDKSKTVVCTSITNGLWVARSCETIFSDDRPKCSLVDGVRSCQCDSYLCNENAAMPTAGRTQWSLIVVGVFTALVAAAAKGQFL